MSTSLLEREFQKIMDNFEEIGGFGGEAIPNRVDQIMRGETAQIDYEKH